MSEELRVVDSGSGCAIKIEELLPWMTYSTIEFESDENVDLEAFTYTRGQRVPSAGLPPRQATEADTNVDLKGRMNHDTSLMVYSITYEIESINNTTPAARGHYDPPGADPPRPRALRTVSPKFHRELQTKAIVEFIVGYQQKDKPKLQLPFSRISQSIGAKVVGVGGSSYMAHTPGTPDYFTPSHSSGGDIRAFNQRRFNLPVEVPSDRPFSLRFRTPEGPLSNTFIDPSMNNQQTAYRIRFFLDGLKQRPGVV